MLEQIVSQVPDQVGQQLQNYQYLVPYDMVQQIAIMSAAVGFIAGVAGMYIGARWGPAIRKKFNKLIGG